MTHVSRDSSPPASRPSAQWGLGLLLLAYTAVLYILIGAVAGGSDTSGYFNEARLLARFEIHEPVRALPGLSERDAHPFLYVPLGYKPAPDGTSRLVPTYPPGLSLMLIPAAGVVGWRHAGDAVLLLHSLAGLALTFALGRAFGLSRPWSLAGAVALAASPLYLFMSLWAMSDVPAMAWTTAAVVTAWKSRDRPAWALAAGVCSGVAFLVRPSDFLIALPMLLAMGYSPRRWILAAAGGLPAVAVLMAINHAAYGGYLESGYGTIWNEFHSSLVVGTLLFSGRWLPLIISPVVVLAPAIVGFFRSRPGVAAVLAAWAASYIGFYSPYRWTHEDWWFLRFLLPAAPALVVAGLIVMRSGFEWLQARIPGTRLRPVFILLFMATVAVELKQIRPLHAWSIGHGELKYGRVAAWLNANVPKNSAIVGLQFSGATYYFTNFILVRSDEMDPATAQRVRSAVQLEGRPVFAVLFPFEQDVLKRFPGKWVRFGSVDEVTIWRGDWGDSK
jgi:4-amino-4-deoxy-L-arabinose transferase-like glycosyltransferase